MPSTSAHTFLELPPNTSVDAAYQQAVNDSMRQIARQLDSLGTAPTGKAQPGNTTGGQLILTAPGLLAIQSSVTPLVSLESAGAPVEILAYLKRAPAGGNFSAVINVKGKPYFTINIPQGATSMDATGQTFGQIPANSVVSVDVTGVGGDFPGADLSVLIRF